MKQAIFLILATAGVLEAGYLAFGYEAVAHIVYGAITVMALLIAGTFLWLWFERATPLAIGMVISWLGISGVAGWWWTYTVFGGPTWAHEHPAMFGILALPMVGSVLHFAVIQRSFGFAGAQFLWPVIGALGLSLCIYVAL